MHGNLFSQCRIQPARDVDRHQFPVLALVVGLQLPTFQHDIGLFGVCLGVDRHVFTCRHRHRPGDPRYYYIAVSRIRGCNTEHQTRRRKDTVIRAQYRCAQPPDAAGAMSFHLAYRHYGLQCDSDRKSYGRIPAVVEVVPVVVIVISDVNVVGRVPIVCPVFRPGVHEEERIAAVREARISQVDRGARHSEPVLTPERETEAGLRYVVTAIASALRPGAMIAVPVLSTILLERAMALPSALLLPAPLLLPRDCLLLRTL